MKIYLVRHGESEANVNLNIAKIKPDYNIALTAKGKRQSKKTAKQLSKLLAENGYLSDWASMDNFNPPVVIWYGPYIRSRDTAEIISNNLFEYGDNNYPIQHEKIEHLLIHERKFGLFDGYSDEEARDKFPIEYQSYKKHKDMYDEFWVKIPFGESVADVAQRANQVLHDIKIHNIENKTEHHVIIGHSIFNRAFEIMYNRLHFNKYYDLKEQDNGEIKVL